MKPKEQEEPIMAQFKNETKDTVKVRGQKLELGYEWKLVEPGELIELEVEQGRRYGFELVSKEVEIQEQIESSPDDYSEELLGIDGIGKARAAEILAEYPQRDQLVVAVEGGEEMPFPDNVVASLKEHFSEE